MCGVTKFQTLHNEMLLFSDFRTNTMALSLCILAYNFGQILGDMFSIRLIRGSVLSIVWSIRPCETGKFLLWPYRNDYGN
jgi:hypothetical protein